MKIQDFKINHTYKHTDIVEAFECGNMGGMRRSKKTNTLILICDHTKGLYDQTVDKVPAKAGIFYTFSRLSGIIIIRKAVLLC